MILSAIIIFLTANIYIISSVCNIDWKLPALICTAFFIFVNFIPSFKKVNGAKNLRIHRGATLLKAFLISTTLSVIVLGVGIYHYKDVGIPTLLINSLLAFLVLLIAFWNGMLRIFIFSTQLRIKWRVIGALCGFIPIVNIIVLLKMIKLASDESDFESDKIEIDQQRVGAMICKTRYPILMVHGVFFRDSEHFNYWGRIPDELIKNGAVIYYGQQQSALSVADSAAELARRIQEIVTTTGCGKVNIIAHSKGGLDSRYAISKLGCDKYVASLTTVNTPHRGCKFAEYLLSKAGEGLRNTVAGTYNAAARTMGDSEPDFIAAVTDLTASACAALNAQCPDMPGVLYQSVGSRSVKAASGRFPLNLSYLLVDHFDGPNDGLVSVDSMPWGSGFYEYKPTGTRGISHGDMIDLNRENIDGFDVREAYVRLVAWLKQQGL